MKVTRCNYTVLPSWLSGTSKMQLGVPQWKND